MLVLKIWIRHQAIVADTTDGTPFMPVQLIGWNDFRTKKCEFIKEFFLSLRLKIYSFGIGILFLKKNIEILSFDNHLLVWGYLT